MRDLAVSDYPRAHRLWPRPPPYTRPNRTGSEHGCLRPVPFRTVIVLESVSARLLMINAAEFYREFSHSWQVANRTFDLPKERVRCRWSSEYDFLR